jgi:hypothetical protein
VPLDGELIIFDPEEVGGQKKFKFGDGSTNVMDLPFAVNSIVDVDELPNPCLDKSVLYRTKSSSSVDTYVVLDSDTGLVTIKNIMDGIPVSTYVVDTLPEIGLPIEGLDADGNLIQFNFYYQTSDEKGYIYLPPEYDPEFEGWIPFEDFSGAPMTLIESEDQIPETPGVYVVMQEASISETLYHYTDKWVPVGTSSNYEENDSTKPSYILNRPFYTETRVEKLSVKTDSPKVIIQDYYLDRHYYYKVSENVCPKDLLVGSEYTKRTREYNGSTLTKDTTDKIVINKEHLDESQEGGISLTTNINFVNYEHRDVHIVYDYTIYSQNVGIPFDSNGIYVLYYYHHILVETLDEESYEEVASFTINETTIHKLDNKYVDLPNNEDYKAIVEEL